MNDQPFIDIPLSPPRSRQPYFVEVNHWYCFRNNFIEEIVSDDSRIQTKFKYIQIDTQVKRPQNENRDQN